MISCSPAEVILSSSLSTLSPLYGGRAESVTAWFVDGHSLPPSALSFNHSGHALSTTTLLVGSFDVILLFKRRAVILKQLACPDLHGAGLSGVRRASSPIAPGT
ncbi:hypothetical protein CPB85DRAFT_1434035 [Mucidula mucida]|nr:hypothetical protein CPB85DRAFT_1434035 [Mucidula mucida]